MITEANTLYSDLWNHIIKMFEDDGIDYMNEAGSIKTVRFDNGDTIITYKDKPYCLWTQFNIATDSSDDNYFKVRGETILRKL